MALGKISGPMLVDNLIRNDIDLAFDTDLLYLDVDNRRIGINTASPNYALTIVGTVSSTAISTGQLTVDNLDLNGNIISTTSGDLRLLADVGQKIKLESDVDIIGDLEVSGSINLTGNITIGNADLDSISISADFVSNLVPNVTNTYDLGTSVKQWKSIYVKDAYIESLITSGTIIDCGTY